MVVVLYRKREYRQGLIQFAQTLKSRIQQRCKLANKTSPQEKISKDDNPSQISGPVAMDRQGWTPTNRPSNDYSYYAPPTVPPRIEGHAWTQTKSGEALTSQTPLQP